MPQIAFDLNEKKSYGYIIVYVKNIILSCISVLTYELLFSRPHGLFNDEWVFWFWTIINVNAAYFSGASMSPLNYKISYYYHRWT